MNKPKKQNRNPLPAIKGTLECENKHRWKVVDLNPELGSVNCPVCGGYTSIKQGLRHDGPKR